MDRNHGPAHGLVVNTYRGMYALDTASPHVLTGSKLNYLVKRARFALISSLPNLVSEVWERPWYNKVPSSPLFILSNLFPKSLKSSFTTTGFSSSSSLLPPLLSALNFIPCDERREFL
jgi:hypothetical protein